VIEETFRDANQAKIKTVDNKEKNIDVGKRVKNVEVELECFSHSFCRPK